MSERLTRREFIKGAVATGAVVILGKHELDQEKRAKAQGNNLKKQEDTLLDEITERELTDQWVEATGRANLQRDLYLLDAINEIRKGLGLKPLTPVKSGPSARR